MNALEILEQIEACGTARTVKADILKRNEDNKRLRKIVTLAYDFKKTFGITTRPVKNTPTDFSMENWKLFKSLLNVLSTRELTGNRARDAWKQFMAKCSEGEQKWYNRVLNKDLKCGISVKTINAAWPQALETFEIMLANVYKPKQMKLKFPVAVEPKLDGMRITILSTRFKAKAYSRGGLEVPTLQFIADEFPPKVSMTEMDSMIFDGEIYSDNWNETMHLVKTKELSKEERDQLRFNLFDAVDGNKFVKNELEDISYEDRRKRINEILELVGSDDDHIVQTPVTIAKSKEEIDELYAQYLEQGYEGAMIKNLTGLYEYRRSGYWLKYKPEETYDGKIYGFYEGKEGTRNEGRLGGFKVKLENGEKLHVGGGLTDKQREDFWKQQEELKGKWLEFKAQEDTANVTKSARFGRFVRFRPDRT